MLDVCNEGDGDLVVDEVSRGDDGEDARLLLLEALAEEGGCEVLELEVSTNVKSDVRQWVGLIRRTQNSRLHYRHLVIIIENLLRLRL
jgi:hypothetical protein